MLAMPRAVRLAAVVVLGLALEPVEAADRWAGLTLCEALERLRSRGMNLVYSSELVGPELHVGREPASGTPREILDALLEPHRLAARDGPDGVVLVVAAARPLTGEVRGTVRAAEDGRALDRAEVSVAGGSGRTSTNDAGEFTLSGIAPGPRVIAIRRAGRIGVDLEVAAVAGEVVRVDLALAELPSFLDEVVVTPSRYSFLHLQPEPRVFLDRASVERLPHIADDLLRVVHRIPGANAGDLSATFGLRGGRPEDVKVLLDGVRLEEPYHLRDFLSLFSVLDAEAVDGVDVMTSAYPVEHGDSVGGIIDVASAQPTGSRWGLGTSFLTAKALGEGVWNEGRSSWAVSVRRGYLDVVFDWLETIGETVPQNTSPKYADLFAAVRFPIGNRSVAAAELIWTHDRVALDDPDEGNTADGRNTGWHLWSNLTTAWGGGLSVRSLVSVFDSQRSHAGTFDHPGRSWAKAAERSRFHGLGLSQDWFLTDHERHLWKWGFEARWARARYNYAGRYLKLDPAFTAGGGPIEEQIEIETVPSGWQLGLYLGDRLRLGHSLTAEVGVRWDRQTWAPGGDQISPRAHLIWSLGRAGTLRASWGRYAQAQGLNQLQVVDGLDHFFPAERAEHRVLSWQTALGRRSDLRVELYQNITSELRPRYENLLDPYEIFPPGEADRVRVDSERGVAKGVEVTIRGDNGGGLSWWVGYALASVEDRIGGQWQPRSWDQRNALSFNLSRQTASGWGLSLAGTLHTGWPTTPVKARWVRSPDGTFELSTTTGPRNSLRFPTYRRLDARVTRTVAVGRGRLRCFLEIANLLNTENVRAVGSYSLVPTGGPVLETIYDTDNWIPVLPSFGIVFEF